MAKVFNKILGFIGLEPDEEYDNPSEETNQQDYSYSHQPQPAPEPMVFDDFNNYNASSRRSGRNSQTRDNKVVSMYKNNGNGNSNLIIFNPSSCDDSAHMIDSLKTNRPIIANFENIDHDKAQRILDMLSGAMYAMNGSVHSVSRNIYVFAPASLEVSGENGKNSMKNSVSSLYMDFK